MRAIAAGANSGVFHQVANWVATLLKNISPRRLSTGTTAKMLNGPCRYLTRVMEEQSCVNLYSWIEIELFVFNVGYCRRKNESSYFPSSAPSCPFEIWLFNTSESSFRTLWSRFSSEIAHVRPLLCLPGTSEPIVCPRYVLDGCGHCFSSIHLSIHPTSRGLPSSH